MNYPNEYEQILKNKNAFSSLPEHVKHDKEFILSCLRLTGFVSQLKHLSSDLKNDRDFFKDVCLIHPWALAYASDNLKLDKELIYNSINVDFNKADPFVLDFLPDEIKKRYKNNFEQLLIDHQIEKCKESIENKLDQQDILLPTKSIQKTKKI